MFPTIDLFSGIGGISYALSDLVDVKLYCDIDPTARQVLELGMKSDYIPRAPIVNSVSNYDEILSLISKDQKIDLLLSSSSCVGFSLIGSRKGLNDSNTVLIKHSFYLIKKIRPSMVFMENVPGITSTNNNKDLEYIYKTMKNLGYNIKWKIFSAADVGAWHIRRRWFCLCVHNSYKLPPLPESKRARYSNWTLKSLNSIEKSKNIESGDYKRLKLLGNSVVPDCVRTAFYSLYSEFSNAIYNPFTNKLNQINLNLILDPSKEYTQSLKKRKRTSKLISEERSFKYYPTPRSVNVYSSIILSERCSKDLGTFIKYEKNIVWKEMVNPAFVEVMMGFPKNYTRIL